MCGHTAAAAALMLLRPSQDTFQSTPEYRFVRRVRASVRSGCVWDVVRVPGPTRVGVWRYRTRCRATLSLLALRAMRCGIWICVALGAGSLSYVVLLEFRQLLHLLTGRNVVVWVLSLTLLTNTMR